jgi:hypothetical protein
MNRFERDAFRLEKIIHDRLPLKAWPASEALRNDAVLADKLKEGEVKEFNGVVYFPKTKTVYCSFYDDAAKVAVLVPVEDLFFEDTEVQKEVHAFAEAYFA